MAGQLQLDMNVVRKIMENDLKYMLPRRHPALRNPELNPDKYVQGIVDEYTQKVPAELHEKLQQMQQQLNDIDVEMRGVEQQKAQHDAAAAQYAERAQEVKSQLSAMLKRLLDMFPDAQHDKVMESLDDSASLAQMFDKNLGFMDRMFRGRAKKQEFQKLYDEMVKLREEIDVSGFVNMDSKIVQNETRNEIESRRHQGRLEALVSRKNAIISEHKNDVQRYEQIVADMHRKVAEFFDAYERRKDFRKHVPAMLNMQGLNEPVAFFQIIKSAKTETLEKLLRHAGLPVASLEEGYFDTSKYIVREGRESSGGGREAECVELITPFFSPEKARDNIMAIMRYLAEHGVEFRGVIKPATYSQINPQPVNRFHGNKEHLRDLIRMKLKSPERITREDFNRIYRSEENSGKYLFRGQTFITSDPMSSYATPTWRPGRTGIVYATTSSSYAMGYASETTGWLSGETMDVGSLTKVDGHVVGFVTVFKNSKRNLSVSDKALEEVGTAKEFKSFLVDVEKTTHPETVVSPYNNPVVERYMIVGNTMVKIDDNDAQWREIMDGMAPDLRETHVSGVGKYGNSNQQEWHGRLFLQRIERWQNEVRQNGVVSVHDIPEDILIKMGYRSPVAQFAMSQDKLTQPQMNDNTQTMQDGRE